MNTIIFVICAIIMSLGGTTNNNLNSFMLPTGTTDQYVKPMLDEEPVPMRGHVRNSGGNIIVGASVGMIPAGESTPLYTDVTDSNGEYYFPEVELGNYTLKIGASGYITKNIELSITHSVERSDTLVSQ